MLSRVHIPNCDSHTACLNRRSLPHRTTYWFGQNRLDLISPLPVWVTKHCTGEKGLDDCKLDLLWEGSWGKHSTQCVLFTHQYSCRLICFKTWKDHHQDNTFHKKSMCYIHHTPLDSHLHIDLYLSCSTKKALKSSPLSKKHIIIASLGEEIIIFLRMLVS